MNTALNAEDTGAKNVKKSVPFLPMEAFTGELPPVTENETITKTSTRQLLDFDAWRITKEKVISNPSPTAYIGEIPIIAPGNITPITAETKGGKTAIANVFIAGAICPTQDCEGFTELAIEANPNGKAVICIDTEQSEADQQYNLKTILRRAGLDATPDYYRSYNTRTLSLNEYQAFTSDLCELCNKEFNGIHLIVIDGGADYITSVNDEPEANAIIKFFISLAIKYNCGVLLIIHANENAGKNGDTVPRGHIGRQAVRKGYCQLHITKSGDISKMQVLRARKAGHDTPVIYYQYSKELGYHISVDADTAATKSPKSSALRNRLEKVCLTIMGFGDPLRHGDLVSKLMQATDRAEITAIRYVNDLVGWGIIEKCDDGKYKLKLEVKV